MTGLEKMKTSGIAIRISQIVALMASLGIMVQMLFLFKTGEAYCLNEGCRIVESLTRPTPLQFNAIGLIFFLTLFFLLLLRERSCQNWPDTLLRIILLSGLSVEGVFISYQLFVAGTLCSYCLTLFVALFVINLLLGRMQFVFGTAVLVSAIFASSLLRFDPSILLSKKNLDQGTYAVKTCTSPTRELYLIFSKRCPHCKKVLSVLSGCSKCEFHFNPIERIDEAILPGIVPEPHYDPNINILTLKILGIDEIPVLIDKGKKGMLFIKGDRDIIDYIQRYCFSQLPSLEEEIRLEFQGEGGVCSLEKECE